MFKASDKYSIEAELLQCFTAQQAWEYQLVPYERIANGVLLCYGSAKSEYEQVKQEVEVLFEYQIDVTQISDDEFVKLIRQHYRMDQRAVNSRPKAETKLTDNGQAFLLNVIEEAYDNHASDIHIEIYEERCRVRLRIDGKLIERYVVAKANYASLVNQIKINANLDISERRLPQDGRILFDRNGKKFDLRVSTMPTINGEKIVMRLLTRNIELLELSNLGFSDKQLTDYRNAIERPHGLILICGPTGSGKSTTLYATLRLLNEDYANILTIEDPIEYTLSGVNQVQLKEDIGLTFGSALRAFLRQDPDIIMLGEIRDADTAQMAIRSSLTGHLILSTIHTNTAWGSISRLTDMEIHPYLIANALILCIAQRLIRVLCHHCKVPITDADVIRQYIPNVEPINCYSALGCAECYYTGYKGRRAIYEVIPVDEQLMVNIRNSETESNIDFVSRGIVSLRESAVEMVVRGETSLEEIMSILRN